MTPEQKAAYVIAQAAEALGQIFAMHAENAARHFAGEEPLNGRAEYMNEITSRGLDHNALISFFHLQP